jgi:DNA-binding cell septation regulator SpoVG
MDANFYQPRVRDGRILAFADVDVANGVIVRGFRVVRGARGPFVAVPSRPFSPGGAGGQTRYYNQVAFVNNDTRNRFLTRLLDAYQHWEKNREKGAEDGKATFATG